MTNRRIGLPFSGKKAYINGICRQEILERGQILCVFIASNVTGFFIQVPWNLARVQISDERAGSARTAK